jgi:hypothetical protein
MPPIAHLTGALPAGQVLPGALRHASGARDRSAHALLKKERKTYARCQACVKGALASKSHRAHALLHSQSDLQSKGPQHLAPLCRLAYFAASSVQVITDPALENHMSERPWYQQLLKAVNRCTDLAALAGALQKLLGSCPSAPPAQGIAASWADVAEVIVSLVLALSSRFRSPDDREALRQPCAALLEVASGMLGTASGAEQAPARRIAAKLGSARRCGEVEIKKKERPTPVARRALRGPLQARATERRGSIRLCPFQSSLSGPGRGSYAQCRSAATRPPVLQGLGP